MDIRIIIQIQLPFGVTRVNVAYRTNLKVVTSRYKGGFGEVVALSAREPPERRYGNRLSAIHVFNAKHVFGACDFLTGLMFSI